MSVRENRCRPSGTRVSYPLSPGTSVPGFHMPPLRSWISGRFRTIAVKDFFAALDALRHPTPHSLVSCLRSNIVYGRMVTLVTLGTGTEEL